MLQVHRTVDKANPHAEAVAAEAFKGFDGVER